jgi:4-aminobutyrate aminotransferase-like enzyme
MNKPAKDIQKALLAKDILAGTAGDPAILRLLPAFILQEEHIDRLRAALVELA